MIRPKTDILVYLSPFVPASIATIQFGLPSPLLPIRELDVCGPALWTYRVVNVQFQRIYDKTGL